jgi:hypothetical protein
MKKWSILLALGFGCGDDAATGDVTFLVQAEDTITEGLAAGDGDENITDGWSVSFDRYAVAIGEIQLGFATDATRRTSSWWISRRCRRRGSRSGRSKVCGPGAGR